MCIYGGGRGEVWKNFFNMSEIENYVVTVRVGDNILIRVKFLLRV